MKCEKFLKKYGPWAMITGASSGIGAEFANQLAEQGLNLVLIARRKDRLVRLGKELQSNFNIETVSIAVDLLDSNFLSTRKDHTKNLEIGLLINNAGALQMGDYLDLNLDEELRMFDLNCKVPSILTREYSRDMIKRKRGGIIFVASVAAYQGTPYLSAYAATKAHNLIFAEKYSV